MIVQYGVRYDIWLTKGLSIRIEVAIRWYALCREGIMYVCSLCTITLLLL